MPAYTEKYEDILFSFLHRDNVFPAIIKTKGFHWGKIVSVTRKSLIQEAGYFFKHGKQKNLYGKIWLFAESVNQFRALEFLTDLPESILVSSSPQLTINFPDKDIAHLLLPTKFKHRILRIRFFRHYKLLFKEKYKDHLHTLIKYDGIYESVVDLLRLHKPKAIVFANDHNAFCRALLIGAKECGIKTIYLQHAAVTDKFPALKFDLNLLDGKDSLRKYKRAGTIEGKVVLIGMPKFDKYYEKIKQREEINTVGIALNRNDIFSYYLNISDELKKQFKSMNFIFRFHPSIILSEIVIPEYATLSDVTKESSFEFISKIDVLIAGNSSIHLEAALMNVASIIIDFKRGGATDYYGFIKSGLVQQVTEEALVELIESLKFRQPNVRHKAKYYFETIGNEWDGKSTKLACNIISDFVK